MKNKSFQNSLYSKVLLVFFSFWYIFHQSKEPVLGDSLSFTVAAMSGFDWATNATNHVLYLNFLHLLYLLFPFIKAHTLFVSVSIFSAILCLYLISKILKEFEVSEINQVFCILLLGFSFTFWRHAEIVEVYTLNLAITALVILWFARWTKTRKKHLVFVSSFILGLAMGVHVQQILYLPFLCWWFYRAFSFQVKYWLAASFMFVLPASLLLLPPALLYTNSFESILFDNSFKNQVLGFEPKVILKGLALSVGYFIFNFGVFSFLLIGVIKKSKQHILFKKGITLIALGVFVFAARYNVTDAYVFFLPVYLVFVLLVALSLNNRTYKTWQKGYVLFFFMFLQVSAFWLVPILAIKNEKLAQFNSQKSYKGGLYFYTWPGMRNAPTAVDVAKKLKSGELQIDNNLELEQNAKKALRYLQLNQTNRH